MVVIGYNDRAHVGEAVRSALAQGPAVAEVIAVDDCSTDGSDALLTGLAAGEPRLRVVRRSVNSGGCGSPRNTGIDAATAPYVMFLDSDDVLPPGAVDALLAAATDARAQVASGLCVRRELPSGREQPWQAPLYTAHCVLARPAQHPRLVHDTLCVNKLYRTDFLRDHGIRFPEGRFLYEDFVFTARVLAASPRMALVPDRVYVWQVRRSAGRLSLSLDRGGIENWTARVQACALAYDILLGAGQKELARAARAKFLDHDVRMYARELGLREAPYRRAWWEHTRAYLARYDAAGRELDPDAPGRLLARVVLASPEPRDLPRLRELAARPARLLPPYARTPEGDPVWSADLPEVGLRPLLTRPVAALPLAVDAELRPRARASVLRLRLHELYGKVAEAGPPEVDVGLVRALHFPRAALPISFALQQLQQLLFSMAALVVILLCFGVPVSASWVLALPALALQFTFNAGVSMVMARMGAKTPDIAQLMPFVLRTWMYVSGVMWSIDKLADKDDLPHIVTVLLEINPAAVYLDLMRFALIDSFHASQLPPHVWAAAIGWALAAGIGGFIYFWKAEETYGRG
ncbi:hypothetical protein SCANM63S_06880 [Streptomyces canarius]